MSTAERVRDDFHDDTEHRLFSLLDAYVESLGAQGIAPANLDLLDPPPELLAAHPELARLLDCLDGLDSLVPQPAAIASDPPQKPPVADAASHPTLTGDAPSDVSFSLRAGRDFGPYELLDEIGRGGMGVVFRARHKSLGAHVALKMILGNQLASAEEVRRFYQEARAAAGLGHSNIVKVHDVGERDGQHFLTMDLVDGGNLAGLLAQGPLEPDRAAELLADVACAVQYLHSKHILHRDLKPSNILLDTDGRPYVTDFGLAKIFETDGRQTSTGTILGTPCYMSPEQAAGRSSATSPQSDLYSLGAILYEMLTGRPPFQEPNPLDTLLRVLEAEPFPPSRLNPRIPPELEQICLRCLEKNPARRYATAAELADDLQHFLKREALTLPAVSVGRRLVRWGRREPALMCRLVALGIAAAVLQVSYWLSDISAAHHRHVMVLIALWMAACWVLQQLLNRERYAHAVQYTWAGVDAAAYTVLLYQADGPIDLLLAGYALLIAASGLWFHVRLVSCMTVMCFAASGGLLWLRFTPETPRHYPGIFATVLLVVGAITAYQVHRIRVLSRYFDRRPVGK